MLKDLIGALVLLLIALAYYLLASDINPSALADEVGAAGLPVVYAALLASIALALAARALIASRFLPRGSRTARDDFSADRQKLLRAGGMLAVGIVYIATVTFIGYLVALAAVIALIAMYQGERAGRRLAAISIGGGITFWMLFDRLLGIEMPSGFWPALWGG